MLNLKYDTKELIYETETDYREPMITSGEREVGDKIEVRVERYKPRCVK